MTTPTNTANQIATAIRAAITDSKLRVRVWSPEGATFARVYTGFRSEYIEVGSDGSVSGSQSRMTWGHKIDEALESLGLS